MATYYHSTRRPLALRPSTLCVTDDRDASREYLEGECGLTYRVELPSSMRVADEADVRDVALELDPETPYTYAWELLEEVPGVLKALGEQGYAAVAFEDMTPNNASTHTTVMVFDGSSCTATLEGECE